MRRIVSSARNRPAARSEKFGRCAVALLVGVAACSGSGRRATATSASSTTRNADEVVPVPTLHPLAGIHFDRAAWIAHWRSTPGSSVGTCVSVGGHADIRSRQFIAGNFASFIRGWDGTYETSKLYYVPLHPTTGSPLVLTARRIEQPTPSNPPITREVVHLRFDNGFAWSTTGEAFYVTGTVLPHAGHWQIEAAANTDRGCFDLDVLRRG
jgi:hypothetical protein